MLIKTESTAIDGLYRVKCPSMSDERGGFGRLFCQETLSQLGVFEPLNQVNLSDNIRRGTVRGLHFQRPPYAESKLVVCIQGKVFDVVVDLRRDSATFGQTFTIMLDGASFDGVLIPKGCAHGFQTVAGNSRLIYFHDQAYRKDAEGGINPFDETLSIDWPTEVSVVSDRDRGLPRFEDVLGLDGLNTAFGDDS